MLQGLSEGLWKDTQAHCNKPYKKRYDLNAKQQSSYAFSWRDAASKAVGSLTFSALSSLSDSEDELEELDELLDMDKVFFKRFFHFSIIR